MESSRETALNAREVRERALAGSALIALRGMLTRVFGLLSSVVVARLLMPEELGMVAFGSTIMISAAFFADGGLAAGLLRRATLPTERELKAILGLQLAITTSLAVVVGLCALPYGTIGAVTAIIVGALPATAFRTPAIVLLERSLKYRPVAFAEVLEAVVFLIWTVVTVSLGLGVYGLATAWVARSVVGSLVLFLSVDEARVSPSWDFGVVRPLLSFGLRYQAVTLVGLLRDQGLNIVIAALAGVNVLGLWSLAYRIIQVPYLLFGALWRVSYPALARLLELGEDPRELLARGFRLTAVGTGLLLVPFVAAAPGLVRPIFGSSWEPIVPVIVISSVGLLVGGPISVTTAGYLYAVGDAKRVLLSAILHTIGWFLLTVPLLGALGVTAAGIGWAASGLIEGLMMALAVRRRTQVSILRPCWRPWCMSAAAVAAVLAFPAARTGAIIPGTAAGLAALALYVVGLVAVREPGLSELVGLVRRGLPFR